LELIKLIIVNKKSTNTETINSLIDNKLLKYLAKPIAHKEA